MFIKRCQNKISYEEWKSNTYASLCSIGEKSSGTKHVHGNRKAKLSSDLKSITYKLYDRKIQLLLPDFLCSIYRNQLSQLYQHSVIDDCPITYKVDFKYVYISFDETIVIDTSKQSKYISNRVLGIDMNPNYVGVTIVDWFGSEDFKIVKSLTFNNKDLFDDYKKCHEDGLKSNDPKCLKIYAKSDYNSHIIAKKIVKIFIYYQCEVIAYEGLDIDSKETYRGKNNNFLINNLWNRNSFRGTLVKLTNIHGIKLQEIKLEYSSFVGNFLFKDLNLQDMCLAAFEISRRGYEFNAQYIKKIKPKNKNIIFPNGLFLKQFAKSLEEFSIHAGTNTLDTCYRFLKNADIMYRCSIDKFNLQFFMCLSDKTKLKWANIPLT